MSNKLTEELRNVDDCLGEQSFCGAHAFDNFSSAADMGLTCADFCADGARDFSCGGRMNTGILTAPKPLLDKAWSKGGGG